MFKYDSPIEESECNGALISSCSNHWVSGPLVVITAYQKILDSRHIHVGDLVLEERLRSLANDRRIEINRPDLAYGKYNVRLMQK